MEKEKKNIPIHHEIRNNQTMGAEGRLFCKLKDNGRGVLLLQEGIKLNAAG